MVKLNNNHKKWITSLLKDNNIDADTIDIEAEWDSEITYQENRTAFMEKFNLKDVKAEEKTSVKAFKEQEEHYKIEQIQMEEKHYKDIHELAVNSIKESKGTDVLKEFFRIPIDLINSLLKSKDVSGLILKGEAGLGKSHICVETLVKSGKKLGEDFVILTGYTTPLELFQFLYDNRDNKILIFDDIMKLFDNNLTRGILLSALWNPSGKRIVNYLSSSNKLNTPKTFEFNSKIIWCVNDLPNELEAIKSRCFYYELAFTHKDRIKIMYEIAKVRSIPFEVVDFIKNFCRNEAYKIDFRLPIKLYDLFRTADNWKELAKETFEVDEEMLCLKTCLDNCGTIGEAIQKYNIETGKSRASFFRLKKKLMNSIRVSKVLDTKIGDTI